MALILHNAMLPFFNNSGGQILHGELAALHTFNCRMLNRKQNFQKFTAQARLDARTTPSGQLKIILDDQDMPCQWYNIIADLPEPPPPALNPQSHEPLKPEDLIPLFPVELIMQEASQKRYIDIPEEVLEVYKSWRPTPLFRAKRLEKLLGTPARIYYKYEGVSPAGSHKPNTAVPQAWYNAQEGVKSLVTETGAGQWGSALAFACSLFDLQCEVWQVRASYDQKPYRKMMMETWGAKVHPSPSNLTKAGRFILGKDPESPGSLGIAVSEAVEMALANSDTKYSLGSVLNHVLLHQTVIGEECIKQMAVAGESPDIIIGCTGGGSNFAGLAFPFIREKLAGNINPIIRAVEPTACPSLTKGIYIYDYADTAGFTPLLKMHTLGHDFVPDPIHAGGLRYHGMAPLISHVYNLGMIEALAIPQIECFQGEIQGAYQIKVTTTALALLLASRHSELAKVYVQGRLIKSSASGIVTRSKAKLAPDQWSLMPLPAKILSLLADMLIEIQEQNTIGVDEDDEWEDMQNSEDDGYTDVTHSVSTTSNGRPVFKNFDAMKYILNEEVQDDDYQDDPLRAADPLNEINLTSYIVDFLKKFSESDKTLFELLCQDLSETEKCAIQAALAQ